MTAKIISMVVIYTAIWITDMPKLKKLHRREIIAYTAILLLSTYVGIDYVWDLKWPFLGDAAQVLLGEPARRIVETLKVPS